MNSEDAEHENYDSYEDDYEEEPKPQTLGERLADGTQPYYIIEYRLLPDGNYKAMAKSLSDLSHINNYFNIIKEPGIEYRFRRYPDIPLQAWRNYPLFLAPQSIPTQEEIEHLQSLSGDAIPVTKTSETIVDVITSEIDIDDAIRQLGFIKRCWIFSKATKNAFTRIVLNKE